MENINKKQMKEILNEIKNNETLIYKLITFLQNNDLLQDLYTKMYYMIEINLPVYKIKYYRDVETGKLFSIQDFQNKPELENNRLERYTVYVYDETKTVHFKGYEVGRRSVRYQSHSNLYEQPAISVQGLNTNNDYEQVDWYKLIIENPTLFIYIIAEYNIDMNKLKKVDEKKYIYKKEIKKN